MFPCVSPSFPHMTAEQREPKMYAGQKIAALVSTQIARSFVVVGGRKINSNH
jgi:hypothetical protein